MTALDRDLAAALVPAALDELAAATSRLCSAVERLADDPVGGDGWLEGASRLPGWPRRTLLAHMHAGAVASVRMTGEALEIGSADFYPGGADERARTLRALDGLDASTVCATVTASARELVGMWAALPQAAWQRFFTEGRFADVSLSRLLMLRLTELSVHCEDLDCGLEGWSPAFVELALPLRLAWLPDHHRARPDADLSVHGRWLLGDGARWWLLCADAGGAEVRVASEDDPADAVLLGRGEELLRVLLGRLPASALVVGGDARSAERLKAAFPGP